MKLFFTLIIASLLCMGCQNEPKKTPPKLLSLSTDSLTLIQTDSLQIKGQTFFRNLQLILRGDTLWKAMQKTLTYQLPIYHGMIEFDVSSSHRAYCEGDQNNDYTDYWKYLERHLMESQKENESLEAYEKRLCQKFFKSPIAYYYKFYEIGTFNHQALAKDGISAYLNPGELAEGWHFDYDYKVLTPNQQTYYFNQTIFPVYRVVSSQPLKIQMNMLYQKQKPIYIWVKPEYDLIQIMANYFPMDTLQLTPKTVTKAIHPLYEFTFYPDSIVTQIKVKTNHICDQNNVIFKLNNAINDFNSIYGLSEEILICVILKNNKAIISLAVDLENNLSEYDNNLIIGNVYNFISIINNKMDFLIQVPNPTTGNLFY